MTSPRIPDAQGQAAFGTLRRDPTERTARAAAVRWTLGMLAASAPGGTLEVRVPPFGAVQCLDGPRHTRGTPPNVVELDTDTWLALVTGQVTWDVVVQDGRVRASGQRASLAGCVPLPGAVAAWEAAADPSTDTGAGTTAGASAG